MFNLQAQTYSNIFHAQRIKPDAKLFIGSGKAEEIAEIVQQLEAELVIFGPFLTPAQARNLETVYEEMPCGRSHRTNFNICQRAYL